MEYSKDEKMIEIFNKYYKLLVFAISKDISSYDDVMNICLEVCSVFYSLCNKQEVDKITDLTAKIWLLKIMKVSIMNYMEQ